MLTAGPIPGGIDLAALESLSDGLRAKLAECRRLLAESGGVVVAFSAGVDSTLLLALAAGTLPRGKVLAAMGISPSLAGRERAQGQELAKRIGVELVEVQTGELTDPAYAGNPAERCFYCKTHLFRELQLLARRHGLPAIVSGANADDTGDFRPGLAAGREMAVGNPLMEAGLTKEEIRTASRAIGLPTWDKPAMACLASRVPYGEPITAERLGRIERAEYALKDLGFAQCRIRDHHPIARVEIATDRLAEAVQRREPIIAALKMLGYTYVCLDLQGFRSGAMNEAIGLSRSDAPVGPSATPPPGGRVR